MPIRAVLWDADGVLQQLPSFDSMWTFLDEETRIRLLETTFGSDHDEVLRGRVDMSAHLDAAIEQHDLSHHRDEIRDVWERFPPVEQARDLLQEVRRAGTTCVLATNQDTLREVNMRPVYEPLLDRLYFSSAMGVAKPDPAYFLTIASDLELAPDELLFVDDSEANVAGAREAGLASYHWHFSHGIDNLRAELARHQLVT